jgi:hypothetical protein
MSIFCLTAWAKKQILVVHNFRGNEDLTRCERIVSPDYFSVSGFTLHPQFCEC